MATKLPKSKGFTKAFRKTKLAYVLDQQISKQGEFVWEYKYKPKLEDNAWHPSMHCTPTLAELYHYAKDAKDIPVTTNPDDGESVQIEPRQLEAGLAKIFQVGHFWHQFLQEICVRAELCEPEAIECKGGRVWGEAEAGTTEFEPKPFHWVTGSGDIAPLEVPGHGPYLIDFKTMGSHTFRPNLPSEQTLEKWECQLNVYMDFFNLEKSMIIGINKDSPHDFKEYEFHHNQELIDALYYKWKLVAMCLDEETEPPEDEEVDLPIIGPVNV